MGEKEWSPSDVFDVFGDRLARRILVLASERPVSADDLSEQLDVSRPTIYRRVNALIDYDLLNEQQRLDADGNHYQTVETTLKQVVFEIEDGGYNVSLEMRQSLADQFESFWSDLDQPGAEETRGVDDQPERSPRGAGADHG